MLGLYLRMLQQSDLFITQNTQGCIYFGVKMVLGELQNMIGEGQIFYSTIAYVLECMLRNNMYNRTLSLVSCVNELPHNCLAMVFQYVSRTTLTTVRDGATCDLVSDQIKPILAAF